MTGRTSRRPESINPAVANTPGADASQHEDRAAAELLKLDKQVCFALAVASRSVIGLYRPVLEPLGLTHPQYLVMLALWEQSPRTLSGLSAELMLEPATLTPLVKRLEAAGLITRARSAHDERALSIELTDTGRALRADAFAVPQRIIERLGMPVDELEQTRDALNRLIEAARA